eukprot:2362210-Pyramimonas_sp.AAC.1
MVRALASDALRKGRSGYVRLRKSQQTARGFGHSQANRLRIWSLPGEPPADLVTPGGTARGF